MKIIVTGWLYPPSDEMFIGSTNYPLFSIENREVEITPEVLNRLLNGELILDGEKLEEDGHLFRHKKLHITVSGYIKNISMAVFRRLTKSGWKLSKKHAMKYGIDEKLISRFGQ